MNAPNEPPPCSASESLSGGQLEQAPKADEGARSVDEGHWGFKPFEPQAPEAKGRAGPVRASIGSNGGGQFGCRSGQDCVGLEIGHAQPSEVIVQGMNKFAVVTYIVGL